MVGDVNGAHLLGKYPLTRCLRPAFFAARRRHLRACFVSMFKSMVACLPLIGILSMFLLVFATVGWIVFDATKNGA
jgi:hypothetical protein